MKSSKTKLQGILKEDVQKMKKSQFSSIRKLIREAFEQGGGSEWQGVDADLETSLFEYGFVAKQLAERDYDDEWFILYRVDDNNFDTGWKRESELDELIRGEDWVGQDDVDSFLGSMGHGESPEDWINDLDFIRKLSDLLSYWSPENIFGVSYEPFPKSEALEMLGVEPDEWRED